MRPHNPTSHLAVLSAAAVLAVPGGHAGAQAGAPPADQVAAQRAMRVAKDIAAPGASPAARAASYREAARIVDSAEAGGGRTALLAHARGYAMLVRAEAALGDARRAQGAAGRCAAARESRVFADSAQLEFPAASESPSRPYHALLERAYGLPDSVAAMLRTCPEGLRAVPNESLQLTEARGAPRSSMDQARAAAEL